MRSSLSGLSGFGLGLGHVWSLARSAGLVSWHSGSNLGGCSRCWRAACGADGAPDTLFQEDDNLSAERPPFRSSQVGEHRF